LATDSSNVAGLECPDELLCTSEEVEHLLNLDESKASGPDGISATMLKHTARTIAPSVTALFNSSIQSGQVLMEWKKITCGPNSEII
jgi:hypothetical protein